MYCSSCIFEKDIYLILQLQKVSANLTNVQEHQGCTQKFLEGRETFVIGDGRTRNTMLKIVRELVVLTIFLFFGDRYWR